MRHSTRRIRSGLTALVLAGAAIAAAAVPASAALQSGCALYPETPYTGSGKTFYAATATCGTSKPVITYVAAALQRAGSSVASTSSTSGGTTSLRAASSTTCSAGSFRVYAWANDKNTNADERGTAYKSLGC